MISASPARSMSCSRVSNAQTRDDSNVCANRVPLDAEKKSEHSNRISFRELKKRFTIDVIDRKNLPRVYFTRDRPNGVVITIPSTEVFPLPHVSDSEKKALQRNESLMVSKQSVKKSSTSQ